MKAVIYARYSSDNQREESIEGQIRECTAFAEKNNITILRHYIDRAFSAKTDNRPEFQNMIKDSGKRLFDMIIVWKLDRFARNRYDSARYKTALKKNGVKVVSATEVISDGAEGIILESVLEGYAEYYSADLSEKVVRGMTENALKSKYNGGTRPIGYLIDSDQYFQLDPLTTPFVREAFQRYDEGATMTAIRDWLNEQGVKNTRGQKMTYNSVQHLLNNRRYIGEYTYRDVVVPDGIPAIVPQVLFERVQEKLAKNKKAPARHKAEDEYLLTTKLFCGYCEAYLYGESGTSHTGNIHRYYKCISVKKKRANCRKKSVRKEWIEDLVVTETMKMVMDDKAIEAIVSMLMDLQDRENVNLPLYEQQLREADTAIQNLLNAIQQGILTKSTKGRLEELEAAKEDLEAKIAREKLAKPKVSAEFMTFWLHRFRKLDVRQKSHRKMLIDTFINAIFLYDDKMVLTFNYKEGTATITFDDLKTAFADQKTGSDLGCSTAPRRSKVRFAPPFQIEPAALGFDLGLGADWRAAASMLLRCIKIPNANAFGISSCLRGRGDGAACPRLCLCALGPPGSAVGLRVVLLDEVAEEAAGYVGELIVGEALAHGVLELLVQLLRLLGGDVAEAALAAHGHELLSGSADELLLQRGVSGKLLEQLLVVVLFAGHYDSFLRS